MFLEELQEVAFTVDGGLSTNILQRMYNASANLDAFLPINAPVIHRQIILCLSCA